jgi:DNA-binding CsgD family transcriptional regulator
MSGGTTLIGVANDQLVRRPHLSVTRLGGRTPNVECAETNPGATIAPPTSSISPSYSGGSPGPMPVIRLAREALAGRDGRWVLGTASARSLPLGAFAGAAAQAAATFARDGLRGSAAVAAARAHRLAQACEGARTPALAVTARPLPLTEREREVATMAARGMSNREIADRLVVSVRTVEGHLYRVGHKLGLGDRGELAALLFE